MEGADLIINPESLKLRNYFHLIISGPSQSGKSKLLFDILDNLDTCVNSKFEKIIFVYGVFQDIYKKYKHIHFTNDLEILKIRPGVPTLFILDDVMGSIKDSTELENLFTHGRHEKISTILIMQNLFYQGRVLKTLRMNASYFAIFEHLQDVMRVAAFATQMERKNSNYFMSAYEDAIKEPYGYLFCDLHPQSTLRGPPYFIKLRSLIHKSEGQILYLDKSKYRSGLLDKSA